MTCLLLVQGEKLLICNADVIVASRVFGVLVLSFFLHFQSPYSKNILIHGWLLIIIIILLSL